MKMKKVALILSVLALPALLQSQNAFCFKYALVSRNAVTDTLHVLHMNGNTFNKVTRNTDGKTSYRSLKLKDKPLENYAIHTDDSYRMIPDVQVKEYPITIMGKEQVNGYNCTKISLMTFQDGNTCYLWISDEVPNYTNYMGVSVIDFKIDRLNEALKKNKLAGFPVKIAFKTPDYISYDLVSAGNCNPDPTLFDLGRYTNAKTKNAPK